MHNLDKQKRLRWRRKLSGILAVPARLRSPMCNKRLSGAGRWTSNDQAAEQRVYDAIMTMRNKNLPVSVQQLRALAI